MPFPRPQPLRVTHISLGLELGGMEKLLVEFARHADRSRFDLQFVSLTGRGRVAAEIEALGFPVTALEQPAGTRPGLIFTLASLLATSRPDVVHTHNAKPLIYGGLAARVAGVPVVVHTRHGQGQGENRRQRRLIDLAARCADCMVGVSDDSTALAAGDGTAPRKLRTILNGIDLSRFRYAGPRPDGPTLYVGRLSPEKDVESLLRAAALVRTTHPQFRLEIAGNGPLRPALERLTDELAIRDVVRFLGAVADVPALLATGRLLVLPSLTEGIALTLLEAMACGLPTVATRVGGNAEVVLDGRTGLLIPPGEPQALAAAISQIYANPHGAAELGAAGRARVEAHFDVRRMVAEYESLYLQALANRRRVAIPA